MKEVSPESSIRGGVSSEGHVCQVLYASMTDRGLKKKKYGQLEGP